eukprot:4365094-Prymnesium_polylepis.1
MRLSWPESIPTKCIGGVKLVYSRKEEPYPMAPMGVSPSIGATSHPRGQRSLAVSAASRTGCARSSR